MRWVLAGLLVSGRAAAQATPPSLPVAASGGASAELMKHARAARAALERRKPPKPQGDGKQFVVKQLGPWLSEARKLHEEALARYQKVATSDPSPDVRVTAHAEAGEMSLALAERIYRAGEAATPKSIAQSPELRATYLSALDDAVEPMRASAIQTLSRCAELATAHAVSSPASRRCAELRDKPMTVDPKRRASPEEVERAVRLARPKLRSCYEHALKSEPALAGELKVGIEIGPSGAVTQVKLSGSLAKHPVTVCVEGVLRALPLPPPPPGKRVAMTLLQPLVFDPAK
jgi:hypothetical protein